MYPALALLLQSRAWGQTATTSPPATIPATTVPTVQVLRISGFRFTGNFIFSSAELRAIVANYVGRELTFEELDDARRKITQHYVEHGYVTSGALLPEQSISD